MTSEFFCEDKLMKLNPALYQRYIYSLFAAKNIEDNNKSFFPEYTNNRFLHTANVVNNCNRLIGDNIEIMNCGEIYILLLSAMLHDSGMGISENDFSEFCSGAKIKRQITQNKKADIPIIIRDLHHELSGCFAKKYSTALKIPDEFVFPIVQGVRGHRVTDLNDEEEYPCCLTAGEYKIRLPYIAAIVRLADELDIESENNIGINLMKGDISDKYKLRNGRFHTLIEDLVITETKCIIFVKKRKLQSNASDEFTDWIIKLRDVINYTFGIVNRRTPFSMKKRSVVVEYL